MMRKLAALLAPRLGENVEESVATLLDQAEVMRSKIAEMSEAEQAKTEQGEAY